MTYVSLFDPERNAVVGEVVLFHHIGDGVDYPAMVSGVMLTNGKANWRPESLIVTDLERMEKDIEGLHVRAQLTVLRPRAIEWPWAIESTDPGGYTRQTKGDQ